jgi:protein-disulfide isomerase
MAAVAQTAAPAKKAAASNAKPPSHASAEKATASSTGRTPTTEELNGFMQHMFGYDPALKWKIDTVEPSEVPGVTQVTIAFGDPVQQRTVFYVASDLQHAFIGQIIPFGADPFAPAREKLAAAKGPVLGKADAPVEIVEFSDMQCPHCKRAQPTLEKLIQEEPSARLVYENFPLSQIHNWAERAADFADCIGRKNTDQFWKFVRSVYEQQEQITAENATEKLASLATAAGADASATATCADAADTRVRVMQQGQLGNSLGVSSTPTIFINGRKIQDVNGTPYEVLKEMVEYEAKQKQ